MFMDYTLCPGGAFIQCESVAAFDPNMPTDVTPEVQEQIVTELKLQIEYYKPVDKVLHKLSAIADQVLELYELPFTEDREENMAKLDQVGDLATEIANCMVMMVTKMNAMHTALTKERFVYEPVLNNLGYFIKNIAELRRQGRTNIQCTRTSLTTVSGYDIGRMLTLYIKAYKHELPDYPFDFDQIRNALAYADNASMAFRDARDFVNCMFHDPERRYRLEKHEPIQFELDGIMSSCSFSDQCEIASQPHEMNTMMVKFISTRLSMIKKCVYNFQLDIMDDATSEMYQKQLRSITSGTVDLFVVPLLYVLSLAYEVQAAIENHNAIDAAVKDLMNPANNQ